VQYWDGGKYVTSATIANSAQTEKSTAFFDTVSTSRLRLYQPANMGSTTYSRVLWVAEVDYGNCVQADADCDGCIRQDELFSFISGWKSGQNSLANLMEAIRSWKQGC
jgi:hypothetical protein